MVKVNISYNKCCGKYDRLKLFGVWGLIILNLLSTNDFDLLIRDCWVVEWVL